MIYRLPYSVNSFRARDAHMRTDPSATIPETTTEIPAPPARAIEDGRNRGATVGAGTQTSGDFVTAEMISAGRAASLEACRAEAPVDLQVEAMYRAMRAVALQDDKPTTQATDARRLAPARRFPQVG